MLSYKKFVRGIVVYLDGKDIGTIRSVSGGFCYQPKGSRSFGDTFLTVNECKASLV